MPLNPDAVGSKSQPGEKHWDSKDAILYALGVGCGVDDLRSSVGTACREGMPARAHGSEHVQFGKVFALAF